VVTSFGLFTGLNQVYIPEHHHICHAVRPLVDTFRSHTSRSPFKGLPRFLLPVGE
jgi:hypothetical protein